MSWQNTFFSKTAFRENRDLVFRAIKWRLDLVIRQILCERYLNGIYCLHTKFCVKIWFYMGFRAKNVFCRITMKKMCCSRGHFFSPELTEHIFFVRRLRKMCSVGSRWKKCVELQYIFFVVIWQNTFFSPEAWEKCVLSDHDEKNVLRSSTFFQSWSDRTHFFHSLQKKCVLSDHSEKKCVSQNRLSSLIQILLGVSKSHFVTRWAVI